MRVLPAGLVLLAAFSLGCDPNPTAADERPPTLVNGMVVAPGSIWSYQYTNGTAQRFGVNECMRDVEALSGGVWETLPPELRLCTADLLPIAPGQTVTVRLDVPTYIPDGTYRFRLRAFVVPDGIEPFGEDIVTPSFEVKR